MLKLEERPTPTPGPGQVLVKVAAAGVNFIDIYQRLGWYKAPLPAIPGNEGAGVVEAVGEGVTEVAVGDRVAWLGGASCYAEYALVPADKLAPLPEALSFELGAAAMVQGITAYVLAHVDLSAEARRYVPRPCRGRRRRPAPVPDRQAGRRVRHRDDLHAGKGRVGSRGRRRRSDPLHRAGLPGRGQAHHRRPGRERRLRLGGQRHLRPQPGEPGAAGHPW